MLALIVILDLIVWKWKTTIMSEMNVMIRSMIWSTNFWWVLLQEVELTKKNEEADKLIEIVGIETEKVSQEKAIADEEELTVNRINKEVSIKQKDCEEDLKKAEPALVAAQAALNTLNKVSRVSTPVFYNHILLRRNSTLGTHQDGKKSQFFMPKFHNDYYQSSQSKYK